MDSETLIRSPQLPLLVIVAITLFFAVVLLLALRQARGLTAWFLLAAVWLRVVSGAYHEYTFAPLVGGLSINALLSVATVMAGLAIIPTNTFKSRWMVPIYLLIALIFASSVYNRTFSGMIDMLFKWGYVFVMIAAIQRTMSENGQTRTVMLLLYCYAPLFTFQLASLALGVAKQTEADGSASYIGGYFHEATFSVMALTFSTLGYVARELKPAARFGLIFVGMAAIILANYRTSMIAVLPMLVCTIFFMGVSTFRVEQRRMVAFLAIPVASLLLALMLTSEGVQDRFGDLFALLRDPASFIKPLTTFTEIEEKILSGRLVIWAGYIEGYLNGTGLQMLIGFGPNSWVGIMRKYAHNTVVSFLYELGVLGVAVLLLIWLTFVRMTLKIRDSGVRVQLLGAQIGFLLLNMATMPHWQIEGNIMFAAIQACVLHELLRDRQSRTRAGSVVRLLPFELGNRLRDRGLTGLR